MSDIENEASGIIEPYSEANMPTVRENLVAAIHENVRGSDFAMTLSKIQEHLDDTPADPIKPGILSSARNEAEMESAINSALAKSTSDSILRTEAVEPDFLIGLVTPPAVALILLATILWPLIGPVALIVAGLGMAMLSFVSVGILEESARYRKFTGTLRNKVFQRKKYQREVKRLTQEAETVRERYDRLAGVRQAKLSAARKALESLAHDFSIVNPGKTLTIVEDSNSGKLSVSAIPDKRYNETDALAAMMVQNPAREAI